MSTSSSLPPELPKRSLALTLLALAAGLSVVGVLVWRSTRSAADAPEPRGDRTAPLASLPPAALPASEPPPPPPPAEEPAASGDPRPAAPREALAQPELTPKAPSAKRDPNCDDPCNGVETPELLSAAGARAGQARSCYERALSNNGRLRGRIEVRVRVSPTGSVCSASLAKDGLGDAAVLGCVLARLRSGKYPPPTGGCVDVSIPMNFTPAGSR